MYRFVTSSLAAGFLVLLAASSCSDEKARFAVNYAPGWNKDAPKVSVFGVFRDGRMNPEAWEDLSPRFRTVLHGDTCDAAVGNSLRALNPPVFSAVDDVARRGGVSDELLEKFAPAAEGDQVLVVMVSGKPPETRDASATALTDTNNNANPVTGGRGGQGGGPGGRRGAGAQRFTNHARESNRFEVSAWLYSKREKKSVFMETLQYTGSTEEDAFAQFVAKLGESLPGATCAPWKADLGVSPQDLESIKDE